MRIHDQYVLVQVLVPARSDFEFIEVLGLDRRARGGLLRAGTFGCKCSLVDSSGAVLYCRISSGDTLRPSEISGAAHHEERCEMYALRNLQQALSLWNRCCEQQERGGQVCGLYALRRVHGGLSYGGYPYRRVREGRQESGQCRSACGYRRRAGGCRLLGRGQV